MSLSSLINLSIIYPILITWLPLLGYWNDPSPIYLYYVAMMNIFGFLVNPLIKNAFEGIFPNITAFHRPNTPPGGCGVLPQSRFSHFSYGMPSGHSQIASMGATFWILYMYDNRSCYWHPYRHIIATLLIVMTLIVSYGRIHVGCHNLIQVLAGNIIGIALGYGIFTGYERIPFFSHNNISQSK